MQPPDTQRTRLTGLLGGTLADSGQWRQEAPAPCVPSTWRLWSSTPWGAARANGLRARRGLLGRPIRSGPGRGTRRRHLDLLSRRRGGERGAALWGGRPVRRVGSETTGRVPRGLAAPLGAVGKSHVPELGSESTRVSGLCLSPCTASCALRAAGSEGQLWNLHIAASACLRGLRASPRRPERTPLLHAHFPPPGTSTQGTAFLTSPHSRLRCVICWLDLL